MTALRDDPGHEMDSLASSQRASPSSSSSSPSRKYDATFNAPLYPTTWRHIHERSCVLLAQSAQLFYVVWRWQRFFTFPSTLVISLPLLISETLVVVCGSIITYFMLWNQIDRPKLRLSDLPILRKDLPTVDVMIPCYNEPVELVRRTMLAALRMDYPTDKLTICLCDDGNSLDMRELVASLKAGLGEDSPAVMMRYIARRKLPGIPHHAKAGNLNNAMLCEGTSGDFLVIFDCDMECKPHFLQALLPHFLRVGNDDKFGVDDKIAMVQSPQSFSNVLKDDPLGQQYRYFYGPILKGWDAAGSTPCCGTNVVFSRRALTSIGGFTYGSITEDFLTSMTLHAAGYQTKYVHEYLASGLAPETVHAFYKQRLRWATGGLQIFMNNNALFKKGLSLSQRFLYFWSGFNTCLSIPMIYVVFCPMVNLLGRGAVRIAAFDMYEYLTAFLPYMALQLLCMKLSYRGVPGIYLVRSLEESGFMLFCYARAFLTVVLGIKVGFKVTSKDVDTSEFWKGLNWCLPMLVYYLLGLLAIASGCLSLYYTLRGPASPPHSSHQFYDPSSPVSVSISMAWLLVVAWQLWPPVGFLLRTSLKYPTRRSHRLTTATTSNTMHTATRAKEIGEEGEGKDHV